MSSRSIISCLPMMMVLGFGMAIMAVVLGSPMMPLEERSTWMIAAAIVMALGLGITITFTIGGMRVRIG
ncbi:MAG: hypothetical protein ACFFEV_00295 [Candidatus Thorarchaeota archaeon]